MRRQTRPIGIPTVPAIRTADPDDGAMTPFIPRRVDAGQSYVVARPRRFR